MDLVTLEICLFYILFIFDAKFTFNSRGEHHVGRPEGYIYLIDDVSITPVVTQVLIRSQSGRTQVLQDVDAE